jgi:short-chain fatty acids transporter
MISRIGLAISKAFERTAPDPFVIAILLTVITALLAVAFGVFPPADQSLLERLEYLLDSWRFDMSRVERNGIWKLLEFSMQMCLILVTGHALAVTRPVRAAIDAVARLPRSTAGAAALVSFIACAAALINWGLGLIVGALLSREVGRSLQARGISAHYPLIVAAGYMGLMVWHGGLSGSAPLSMTTPQVAGKVIPQSIIEQVGGVPLSHTIFSPMNLFITGGLIVLTPLLFSLLAPKREDEVRTPSSFNIRHQSATSIGPSDVGMNLPDYLDRSRVVTMLLAVPLALALGRFAQTSGWNQIGLNEINAAMLALGLILHGSARSYMTAAGEGAAGCAGIIIQFPLYAGIMAMMQDTGLVRVIAEQFNQWGNQSTIPLLSFASASVVNMFVPSGGGQWAVQGPIALQSGIEAGIAPGKMIMSVAYGDQLTNMLQPFWALPLLAITGVRARDIVGYTAVVMLVAALWIAIGLLLF